MYRLCHVCGEDPCVCRKAIDDGRRSNQGSPLCGWVTAGRLCNMIATGGEKYCNWHMEWRNVLDGGTGKSEPQALIEWLQLFAPGGQYGANPGQWWADHDTILAACHGIRSMPIRTEAERRKHNQAHWQAWEAMRKNKAKVTPGNLEISQTLARQMPQEGE